MSLINTTVGNYRVTKLLGEGGMGAVYLGEHPVIGRKVAIKFFTRATGLDFALLKQEVAKLLEMVNERRVVQLLRVGWEAEPPYYVMEFLPGGSLAAGSPADVTLLDLGLKRRVEPERFASKGRNTPFAGWTLEGWPVTTIVAGRVVWSGMRS